MHCRWRSKKGTRFTCWEVGQHRLAQPQQSSEGRRGGEVCSSREPPALVRGANPGLCTHSSQEPHAVVALPGCDMETARALPEISFWWQLWALTANETLLPWTLLESHTEHKNQNQEKSPTRPRTPASFYVPAWWLKIRPVSKCAMKHLNKADISLTYFPLHKC